MRGLRLRLDTGPPPLLRSALRLRELRRSLSTRLRFLRFFSRSSKSLRSRAGLEELVELDAGAIFVPAELVWGSCSLPADDELGGGARLAGGASTLLPAQLLLEASFPAGSVLWSSADGVTDSVCEPFFERRGSTPEVASSTEPG